MKKIVNFLFVLVMLMSGIFNVQALDKEETHSKKTFQSNVIPDKMGKSSVIEFVSKDEFVIIEGYIIDGYDIDVFDGIKDEVLLGHEMYPEPVKGLKVTYADDGLILDLIYPEGLENPLLKEKEFISNFEYQNIQPYAMNIEGYVCDSYSTVATWGSYPNKLYDCTRTSPICPTNQEIYLDEEPTDRASCTTTTYTRIGAGRATTFSDNIGQANISLKKGDVATKLAYDNVKVGTILSVKTKTSSGATKAVNMVKNDAGGMPNAVLDIWKTGVEYWGYTWNSSFSMPHKITYQYRR